MREGLLAATVDRTAAFLEQHIGPDRPFDVVRWRERANRTGDLTELRHELDRPLVAPTGRVADTWRDLLALAFGLIDGSPLPEGIDAEVAKLDARRLVVTAPDKIVPDPREAPPPSPDGSQPRACDPLTLRTQMAEEPAADAADAADLSEAAPPPASSPVVGRDGPVWIVGESIAEALLQGRAGAADPPPQPLPPEPTEQDRKLMEKARRKLARRQRRRARRGLLGRLLGPLVLEGAASWAVWTRLPLLLAGLAQGVLLIALGGVYAQMARCPDCRRQRSEPRAPTPTASCCSRPRKPAATAISKTTNSAASCSHTSTGYPSISSPMASHRSAREATSRTPSPPRLPGSRHRRTCRSSTRR